MLVNITSSKTYNTRENAVKAVEKNGHDKLEFQGRSLRWFVMQGEDGRYFPVFLGEVAVQAGMHFKYNVLG